MVIRGFVFASADATSNTAIHPYGRSTGRNGRPNVYLCPTYIDGRRSGLGERNGQGLLASEVTIPLDQRRKGDTMYRKVT
jgi:hypothetical protein